MRFIPVHGRARQELENIIFCNARNCVVVEIILLFSCKSLQQTTKPPSATRTDALIPRCDIIAVAILAINHKSTFFEAFHIAPAENLIK